MTRQDDTEIDTVDVVVAQESPEVASAEYDHGSSVTVGLIAYSALAAMTRLAKDGDQAPSTRFHVDLASMANRSFTRFQALEDFGASQGFSMVEAAGQYAGMFDELDYRTRPSNWWERSVKSYIVIGIFADVLRELAHRHQLFEEDTFQWDLGHGQWVREHLAPLTEADPQLAARLSLWGRRVAGEAFGLLRATLFTYPELAVDPDTVDAVVSYAAGRHQERMEAVNLKA